MDARRHPASVRAIWTGHGRGVRNCFRHACTTRTTARLRNIGGRERRTTEAFFALEKIDGPVLFLSAGDDQIWNSSAQAKMGLAYLKSVHHPFADEWHDYPAAGHLFLFATPARPFVDAPFVAGLTLALGGTPDANVAAAADAHTRIATFLTHAFR